MRRQRTTLAVLVAGVLGLALGRGCGFGPEDQFTGRRIGDGVAPYSDQGEVRICAGNDRFGSPSSMPGGFCGKPAPTGGCGSDLDCKSRERCVCGLCSVQFCSTSAECGTGRGCSFVDNRCDRPCASRADCAAGESCINQVCRSGPCTSDSQCQAGERCGSATPRRCVVDPCDDDVDCNAIAGNVCKVQRRPRAAREPSVLVGPGARPFLMWLALDEPGNQVAIYRADSNDGRSFRLDPGDRPVIAPIAGDAGKVDAPTVIRTDSGFEMVFEVGGGTALAHATSSDGKTWARAAGSILTPAGWESGRVAAPALVRGSDGARLLFYEGGDGVGIGLAIAPAGSLSFARAGGDGLVLSPRMVEDPVLWRSITAVKSPTAAIAPAVRGGDRVRLWFSARGIESAAARKLGELVGIPANFSIGYAEAVRTGAQLSALVPHSWNPVLDRIEGFLVHPSELSPAVIEAPEGERFLLYYGRAAADGSNYSNIGVAENP